MKSKLADWDEQDMVYARHWYAYLKRAGATRKIKRRMHKRWRREGQALVRKEATNPESMPRGLHGRVVLEERRKYSTLDEEYFEQWLSVSGKYNEENSNYKDQVVDGKYPVG